MSIKNCSKWYIATTIIGSEESIFSSLLDKIKAYDFDDHITEMKIVNCKDVRIEFFDEKNPPPKSMKNSKNIQWEALDDGRYKKTTTKVYNKFPGYIFINMIMTDEIWYIIRNTPGITGFIGSSGKGAKPIPISEFEVEDLFGTKDDISVTYINEKPSDREEFEKKIQNLPNEDDFVNNKSLESVEQNKEEKENAEPVSITNNDDIDKLPNTQEQPNEMLSEPKEANIVNGDINDFKVGHTVLLLTGPFIGEEAIIKFIDHQEQTLNVEIDLLGRPNIVKVTPKEIKKVD